jgi:hypothetical protein
VLARATAADRSQDNRRCCFLGLTGRVVGPERRAEEVELSWSVRWQGTAGIEQLSDAVARVDCRPGSG